MIGEAIGRRRPVRGPRRGAPARILRAALAAGLCAAALGACAAMPKSGPVQPGNVAVTEPGSIALLARMPGPGDSPEDIVEGFLRAAAAGLTDDFGVAREFLATSARTSWDPLARVGVYTGQTEVGSRTATGSVAVGAALAATVDDGGRYTEAVPGTRVSLTFALGEDARGEWRITELDDGVLLSEPIFRSLYQHVPLSFVAPDGAALVAETRWYPMRSVETAAVAGLLAGPSEWLAGSVTSAFPAGTQLVVGAVTVQDGVAQVDLSREALDASPAERAMMLAQFAETLVALPRVDAVVVTVEGVPFDAPEPPAGLVVDPTVGSNPVVLAGGALRMVEGGRLVPLGTSAGPLAILDPSQPALPYADGPPVVVSGGSALVTAPTDGAAPVSLLVAAGPLTGPTYDRLGWVWTSRTVGDGVVHAVRADAARVDVEASWLLGREIRALRVSRDGARAVVVSVDAGTVLVEVTPVLRDADGRPMALGEPLRIGQKITQATAAVWVDRQTVAVLGRTSAGTAGTVVLVPVGGPSSPLPAVDGAVGLASGRGDRLLYVSTVTEDLFARNGLGWTSVVGGVRDPAFPG